MKAFKTILLCIILVCGFVIYSHWSPGSMTVDHAATATPTPAPMTAEQKAAADKASEKEKVVRGQVIVILAAIGQSARDPDSIEYRNIMAMDNGGVCVEYTATNAFNARVRGFATLPPKSTRVYFDNAGGMFNKFCGGKQGRDILAEVRERGYKG